jgi:hypothetical protein
LDEYLHGLLFFHSRLSFRSGVFPSGFSSKLCLHFISPPCLLHTPLFSSFGFVSSEMWRRVLRWVVLNFRSRNLGLLDIPIHWRFVPLNVAKTLTRHGVTRKNLRFFAVYTMHSDTITVM